MSPCPEWCVAPDCDGEHWSDPGSAEWPEVMATGCAGDETPRFYPHPVWTEVDGMDPTVALWITRASKYPAREIEETVDFTPAEAREFASRLIAAAEAVEQVMRVASRVTGVTGVRGRTGDT